MLILKRLPKLNSVNLHKLSKEGCVGKVLEAYEVAHRYCARAVKMNPWRVDNVSVREVKLARYE